MNDIDRSIVEVEADDIIKTYGVAGDADELDKLAADTLAHMYASDESPEFMKDLAEELRRRATEARRAQLRVVA